MILLQNSILKLDYNPATDVLEVDYPDLQGFLLPEIKHSIIRMVEIIRNYDVKLLLIDISRTVIDVSDEENKQISLHLATELKFSRLQKMARVQPLDLSREEKAQVNIQFMKQQGLLPYQVKSFTDKMSALEWLQNKS